MEIDMYVCIEMSAKQGHGDYRWIPKNDVGSLPSQQQERQT